MFYRIIENRVYDYADYEYANDCLNTNICTMQTFQQNPDIFVITDNKIEYIPNYKEVIIQKRQEQFEKEFFITSLGWIRRQVTMKDGSTKDFLSDLLLPIKAGMDIGKFAEIITYKTPDFTQEITASYIKTLQQTKLVNKQFIEECLLQTVQDFGAGVNQGVNQGVNSEVNSGVNSGVNREENSDESNIESSTDFDISPDENSENRNEDDFNTNLTGGSNGI